MTYQQNKYIQLISILKQKNHSRNPLFQQLKLEVISKLGVTKFEKMLHRAKVEVANEKP